MSVGGERLPLSLRPTRERILRAGLRLFQHQGYHATGISEILSRAGATKGSFYHHFPDGKQALAAAAVHWLQAEVTTFMDTIVAEGGSAADMVIAMARRTAEGFRHPEITRGSLLSVLAQEAIPDQPAVHAALRQYLGAMRQRIGAARLREGASGGQALAFADQALALLQGMSVIAEIDGDSDLLEARVSEWLAQTGGPPWFASETPPPGD
jgi:TetR/AcrR family transcriptional repressor of lmrAB and yxaGH operons